MEQFRAGKKPVLIVDEAQGLSIEALEEIRLLLNLETEAEKLLQVVLVGQPELEAKLKRPELSQLQQRIEIRCSTAPLRLKESHFYISEWLRIAGANGNPIFPAETMDLAHFYSKGIPRVLNLLCEHALINTFAEESRLVRARAVEEAAIDFLLADSRLAGIGHRSSDEANDNPPSMKPLFGPELTRPLTAATETLHDQARAKSSPAPAALAIRQQLSVASTNPRGFARASIATLVFVTKIRMRISATTQRNSHVAFLAKTFRRWAVDFARDWKSMMNATELIAAAKSLSLWLRHPAVSKRMNSSRKQTV